MFDPSAISGMFDPSAPSLPADGGSSPAKQPRTDYGRAPFAAGTLVTVEADQFPLVSVSRATGKVTGWSNGLVEVRLDPDQLTAAAIDSPDAPLEGAAYASLVGGNCPARRGEATLRAFPHRVSRLLIADPPVVGSDDDAAAMDCSVAGSATVATAAHVAGDLAAATAALTGGPLSSPAAIAAAEAVFEATHGKR